MNRKIDSIKKGVEMWKNRFALNPPETTAQSFAQEHIKIQAKEFEQHAPEHVKYLLTKLEQTETALLDSHVALAAALLKNGSSMDFNYHDFFDLKRMDKYEFTKHENYHNDSVTIKVREKRL